MNPKDLKKLTTPELLEIYNTHAKKPIKRFSDRKAALRRTALLIEELNVQAKPKVDAPTPKDLTNAHRKSKAAVIAHVVTSSDKKPVGREFSSLFVAFKELDLPIGIHKTFRRALKLAGKKEINGVMFHATYKD